MLVSQALSDVFEPVEIEDIVQAVKYAEIESSCEFKVHVDRKCTENSLQRANNLFYELNVDKTQRKNGILFYLAVDCRRFVIVADDHVRQTVSENFWDDIYAVMLKYFRKRHFAAGLSEAILLAGEKLKPFFPWFRGDVNEVNDNISME